MKPGIITAVLWSCLLSYFGCQSASWCRCHIAILVSYGMAWSSQLVVALCVKSI